GAGTPVQLRPASSVRATEVQYWVAQWPGGPAWPITQPVRTPTKVTEAGRKLPGTGGRAGPARLPAPHDRPRPPPVAARAEGGGRVTGPGAGGRRRVWVQHRQVDHFGDGHRRGHDHRRGARGDGQLAVLAAPRPALDQLERARRRRERLDPLAQPGVHVVAAGSPPGPSAIVSGLAP